MKPNRGTILIVVLVCLAVASTILLGVVGVSVRHRQQVRAEVQLEQTYWLLDAGIGKAIAKFEQDADFEDFAFTTDGSLKNYSGSVEINAVEQNDKQVVLRVTAKLQGLHELSPITQRSRVIVLKINKPIKTIQ